MDLNILIVDDHDLTLLMQNKIWQKHYDIKPDTAKSAREVFEMLKYKKYDIIVSDLIMPGISGKQMVLELRKQGHKMPIVMLSAENNINSVKECISAGANDYILKPLDKKLYFKKISKFVNLSDIPTDLDLE